MPEEPSFELIFSGSRVTSFSCDSPRIWLRLLPMHFPRGGCLSARCCVACQWSGSVGGVLYAVGWAFSRSNSTNWPRSGSILSY